MAVNLSRDFATKGKFGAVHFFQPYAFPAFAPNRIKRQAKAELAAPLSCSPRSFDLWYDEDVEGLLRGAANGIASPVAAPSPQR
jgi:hypothetical protein